MLSHIRYTAGMTRAPRTQTRASSRSRTPSPKWTGWLAVGAFNLPLGKTQWTMFIQHEVEGKPQRIAIGANGDEIVQVPPENQTMKTDNPIVRNLAFYRIMGLDSQKRRMLMAHLRDKRSKVLEWGDPMPIWAALKVLYQSFKQELAEEVVEDIKDSLAGQGFERAGVPEMFHTLQERILADHDKKRAASRARVAGF